MRHGRADSMSCSRQRARHRHRKQVWSVRFAKRRTVPLRTSIRSASCSSARLVDTDGTGTIRGRSVVDGFDPYRSHWRENAPPMTLIETSWQLTSPRGRVLTCGLFRTIAGLEVRCGYGEADLIRSQYAREVEAARAVAADWKAAAELKGFR
jgi:hypothetical protein